MLTKEVGTAIPKSVQVREERMWIANREGPRDVDPTGRWSNYAYRNDPELEAMLQSANDDPVRALQLWFQSAFQGQKKQRGVCLIPGPLQALLELPVRQIYIQNGGIYRIEANGDVTTCLL